MACEPPDGHHPFGVRMDATGAHPRTARPLTAHPRTALTRTVLLNGMETVSIIGSRQVSQHVNDPRTSRPLAVVRGQAIQ